MIDPKTKRITIPVSADIDQIRARLAADTGLIMSYNQIFNFLIHFYIKHSTAPRTRWQSVQPREEKIDKTSPQGVDTLSRSH